ncbi:tetratricopeptide repeat protein [Cecembia rubra]|uniref:tetratricopeptide repeat protein n=1 Tax=Cecembia rubra TaxID=1485585 RepID=UPI002714D1E6|nr:tetratricopeptide repeat protein [Cecembia rubra]
MFKNLPTFFLSLLLFANLIGCSPKLNKYENLLDGIKAQPEYLVLHRDSVRVRILGMIPLQSLPTGTSLILYPEYQYGNSFLRLGRFVLEKEEASSSGQSESRIDQAIIFPYLEGMESGSLVLQAELEKEGSRYALPEKNIAQGLNTSPLLARMGQITPDEPISPIGLYMTSDLSGIDPVDLRVFTIPFKLGTDQLESQNLPSALVNLLKRGEQGKVIRRIRVIGLVSPENQELADPNLSRKRAVHLKGVLTDQKLVKADQIEVDYRNKDWFDFRMLIGDFPGLNPTQIEEYYTVILEKTDFESQLRKMRQLKTYNIVNREVFPKLRGAKIEVELEDKNLSGSRMASKDLSVVKEGNSLEGYTVEHLIYMAQSSNQLDHKEAIYSRLVDIFPTESSYNNLGVVYLNAAQRELDLGLRRELIEKSDWMFRKSLEINKSSIAWHNLGRALILKGEYFNAYLAISEASGMEAGEDSETLMINEGLRGALDIINGDYKLATIRLVKAKENEVNFFNKGLAYFLAGDLQSALISFEESVQAYREYGYGFYGLAMIAAVTGDKAMLFENLGKAIERSEFLKDRALLDVLFFPYHQEEGFRMLFD